MRIGRVTHSAWPAAGTVATLAASRQRLKMLNF
jgi:hypothetical protein